MGLRGCDDSTCADGASPDRFDPSITDIFAGEIPDAGIKVGDGEWSGSGRTGVFAHLHSVADRDRGQGVEGERAVHAAQPIAQRPRLREAEHAPFNRM